MAQRRLDLEKPRKSTRVSTLFYILVSVWRKKQRGKRRGAFKSKREGYALFKASHVLDVKFNSSHDDFCFFDARVKACMTRNKMYRTKVRQNKTGEVVSAQCTCKTGANGYCKHVGVYYMPYLTSLKVALG